MQASPSHILDLSFSQTTFLIIFLILAGSFIFHIREMPYLAIRKYRI